MFLGKLKLVYCFPYYFQKINSIIKEEESKKVVLYQRYEAVEVGELNVSQTPHYQKNDFMFRKYCCDNSKPSFGNTNSQAKIDVRLTFGVEMNIFATSPPE